MKNMFNIISEKLKERSVILRIKISEKDFTRERKIGLGEIMFILIRNIKKSLQIEIEKFLKSQKDLETDYSKQAFSKARKKINPEGIKYLNQESVKEYYAINNYKRYKGYRLLGVDGSVISLPITEEIKRHFGTIDDENKRGKVPLGQASMLYDIENEMILDSKISEYKSSERTMAEEHIRVLGEEYSGGARDLIIFDRGYPSIYLLCLLEKYGMKYVMRVNNVFLKETNEFINKREKEEDVVEVELTRARLNKKEKLKRVLEVIEEKKTLKIRIVRLELSTGDSEYLITNLTKEEESREELKELYIKRWGIETKYDYLKNILELENFSGKTVLNIEQDFYLTVLFSNITSDMAREIENEEEASKKEHKYEKYKVNRNILTGLVKEEFYDFIFEEDEKKRNEVIEKIKRKAKKQMIPERKGRSFERVSKFATKYPQFKKSSY